MKCGPAEGKERPKSPKTQCRGSSDKQQNKKEQTGEGGGKKRRWSTNKGKIGTRVISGARKSSTSKRKETKGANRDTREGPCATLRKIPLKKSREKEMGDPKKKNPQHQRAPFFWKKRFRVGSPQRKRDTKGGVSLTIPHQNMEAA